MEIVCAALLVYEIILIIRIVLSWVSMTGRSPATFGGAARVVYDLTEPILGFFRGIIPPLGPLDISPLIVFILIGVIQGALGCGGLF
jgi:YggT family protein